MFEKDTMNMMCKKCIQLDINSIDRHGYNFSYCIDDCIATITKYEGIGYELMYLDNEIYIDIEILKNTGSVLEAIKNVNKCYSNLKKYYGMSLYKIDNNNESEYIKDIYHQLNNNRPFIAHLDGYYIEWDVDYKRRHNMHLAIIVGMDDNKIYIVDPFYNRTKTQLSIADFLVVSQFGYAYEIENKHKNLSIKLENMYSKEKLYKLCSELNKLEESFIKYFDIKKENSIERTFDEVQDILIGAISNRGRYFNVIEYLYKVFNKDNCQINIYMEHILKCWVITKNMINKNLLTGKENINKALAEKIRKIIFLEKELYEHIVSELFQKENIKCSSDNVKLYDKYDFEIKDKQYLCIDISDKYNNHAFGNIGKLCGADLTNGKEMILYNGDDLSYVMDISFKTNISKSYLSQELDNISCKGQKIELNKSVKVSGCAFLVTSEFGEAFDIAKLSFNDKLVAELYLRISDISMKPLYNEKIAWIGETYYIVDKNGLMQFEKHLDEAHIYLISYIFNELIEIDKIELPNCSNIHLFAITFII